jgi:hypothetical protein
MRRFSFLVLLVAASAMAADRAGGGYNGNAPRYSGFGNVVTPGTPRPIGGIADPGFGRRLGATVGGYGYGGGYHHGPPPVTYVPYAYPVYVGSGFGYDYQNPGVPQQQQPQVIVVYPQQQQQPQIIYAPNPSQATPQPSGNEFGEQAPASESGIHVYEAPVRPQQEEASSSNYYLIAFKDHTIYSAMAYWVEKDTLHYVTTRGTHNQASLDLIDRAFTEQLNRDRNVKIQLNGSK